MFKISPNLLIKHVKVFSINDSFLYLCLLTVDIGSPVDDVINPGKGH